MKLSFSSAKKNIRAFWEDAGPNGRSYLKKLVLFFYLYTVFTLGVYILPYLLYKTNFPQTFQPYLFCFTFLLIVAFSIVRWKKIQAFRTPRHVASSIVLLLCAILVAGAPVFTGLQHLSELFYLTLFCVQFLVGLLVFVVVFGPPFILAFAGDIAFISALIALSEAYQLITVHYWMYFSHAIIRILSHVIPIATDQCRFDPNTYLISVKSFSVTIFPACAGFDSMAVFSLLFIASMAWLFQTHRLRFNRAVIAYVAGLAVMFALNVLRVAIILLVGAFWNKDLALNLFHTYLSAIFLLATFYIYLRYVIPWIIKAKRWPV